MSEGQLKKRAVHKVERSGKCMYQLVSRVFYGDKYEWGIPKNGFKFFFSLFARD